MPEAIPAVAPQAALTVELGIAVTMSAMLENDECEAREGVSGSTREEKGAADGAYRCLVEVGDGGSGASVAIVESGLLAQDN